MTAFDLQIIGFIVLAFVVGVVIGYLLRTRVFPTEAGAGDAEGVALESRQARQSNALLRGKLGGGKSRRETGGVEQKASEAAVADQTTPSAIPPADKTPPTTRPDNLQDIKGIGAVLEKQLNELGITRFEQIAQWTEEDVARINETLKFRGRIQRERWVEQAREFVESRRGGL